MFLFNKQRNAIIDNPWSTVTRNGILGFNLGDSYNFALSRIKHLRLFSKEDKEYFASKQNMNKMFGTNACSNSIQFGTDLLVGIKNVSIHFDERDRLNTILVSKKKTSEGLDIQFRELYNKLCPVLGECENYSPTLGFNWSYPNSQIVAFCEGDALVLSIESLR